MINALSNRSTNPDLDQNIYLNQASLGLVSDKTVTKLTEFLSSVARYCHLTITVTTLNIWGPMYFMNNR